ncbi:glucosamine 6-phosphate N-acetyltransferase [Strongylocentrotus purpuratus]|uniref:Glucosamine 6-phosphate N-acetyltransferase n=1 Tax=Strongylocentrotus purpuratus TaxID=7668 RepID=A0A7M7PUQ4_STRPU|nr:glucosamine 6-phosphate N-acetyltransferase [Strongylocentrotus purpuratus]
MENNIEETPMFDPKLLEKLKADFESISKVSFKPPISPANPGNDLLMRPLQIGDYDKGYLQLLSQLTTVGDVPRKLFEEQFHAYKACPNSYYIIVIEDTSCSQVVATGTLGIDFKFTHMCSKKGKLDEVVVKEEYRGKQLGKLMVETLTLLSQQVGCYKTTLECKTDNIPFYTKFGYKQDPENYMTYRHEHCSLNKEEEINS